MQKGLFTSQPANVWLWSAPFKLIASDRAGTKEKREGYLEQGGFRSVLLSQDFKCNLSLFRLFMQKGLFTSQPANVWLWSAPKPFISSHLLLKAITDNQVFPSVLWDSNLMQEPNLLKHRREKANPK